MMSVVSLCSCRATSPYREVCIGLIGEVSGVERPCAMIFTLLGL